MITRGNLGSRKYSTALLLLFGLSAASVAKAQFAADRDKVFISPRPDAANNETAAKWNAEHKIDTPENRQFADRIYATAFSSIDRVRTTKGNAQALELSENPESNRALMAILKEAKEGQYLLADYVIVQLMKDTPQYLNSPGSPKAAISQRAEWNDLVKYAQSDLSTKIDGEPELVYLNRGLEITGHFGPMNKKGINAVLAANRSVLDRETADWNAKEAAAAEKARTERETAAKDEEARLAKAREAEEQARITKEKETTALAAKVVADNAARIRRRADAITQFCGGPQSTVNASSLASLLAAHTALATVDMGYRGIAQNPIMINGRPEQLPVKTEVFPDGHIKYRIEAGIFHTDAARYSTYKSLVLYRFDKVEAKSDSLEIRLPVKNNPDPKEYAVLKLMFDKGWQSTMTTEQAVETIEKYLSIDW